MTQPSQLSTHIYNFVLSQSHSLVKHKTKIFMGYSSSQEYASCVILHWLNIIQKKTHTPLICYSKKKESQAEISYLSIFFGCYFPASFTMKNNCSFLLNVLLFFFFLHHLSVLNNITI